MAGTKRKSKAKNNFSILNILFTILKVLVILFIVFLIYASFVYYKADLSDYKTDVTITQLTSAVTYGDASTAKAGFIFYPGAQVEYTAYQPLMDALAKNGVFCIVVKMPFNYAFFNPDAAVSYVGEYTTIQHWYIGGHSLGGAMAASCASKNADLFDGVVMLAAYSGSDLTKTDLKVLSVYGSNDGVLIRKTYEKDKKNLPDDFTEYVIDGGNHSQFGSYGLQKGDNNASISRDMQIAETAAQITALINK
jgi:dienelactone hydrolase